MMLSQVSIGTPVEVELGIYIAHGPVVIVGFVTVESGVVLLPWVRIRLRVGNIKSPHVGSGVLIGTAAKMIGPISVKEGAVIGANAVVVSDVAPGQTVLGAPGRPR